MHGVCSMDQKAEACCQFSACHSMETFLCAVPSVLRMTKVSLPIEMYTVEVRGRGWGLFWLQSSSCQVGSLKAGSWEKTQVFFIIYFKPRSCRICKKISLWKRDELVYYIEAMNCWNELPVPLYVDIIHFVSESEHNMLLIWNHWLLAKKLWKMRRRFFQSGKDAFSSLSSTAHWVPLNHSVWNKSWEKTFPSHIFI